MLVSLEAAILGRAEQARDAFTRLRGIDSDPRWVYALAGRAYESGEWALVPQYAEVLAGGVGWPNQDAHYAGFKAVLALQRSSQRAAAESLLERIAAALPPRSWAAGVTSYLRGALDDEAFLARARSLGERTEAHAYIGLMAAIGGRREVALTHLRWVAERGDRTYAEYAMVRQELQRLGDVQGLPR